MAPIRGDDMDPSTGNELSAAAAGADRAHDDTITVLLCRDLGPDDLLAGLAAAARQEAPGARVVAVDDLCGHPRRLRSTAARLNPARTVVACRRAGRNAADIRLALIRGGVQAADVVVAELAGDHGARRHRRRSNSAFEPAAAELDTAARIAAARVAAAVRAATALAIPSREAPHEAPPPPAEPARCRSCGAVIGGTLGTSIGLATIAARLTQSHPAIADRLLHADRCADCLLADGIAG